MGPGWEYPDVEDIANNRDHGLVVPEIGDFSWPGIDGDYVIDPDYMDILEIETPEDLIKRY